MNAPPPVVVTGDADRFTVELVASPDDKPRWSIAHDIRGLGGWRPCCYYHTCLHDDAAGALAEAIQTARAALAAKKGVPP